MGATASVEAAESLPKNRPSGEEREAMNSVSGAAREEVRLSDQNASFQHRIRDSRPVDATPGSDKGSSTKRSSPSRVAPSMRPASRMSRGTSLKKVNSIHT